MDFLPVALLAAEERGDFLAVPCLRDGVVSAGFTSGVGNVSSGKVALQGIWGSERRIKV